MEYPFQETGLWRSTLAQLEAVHHESDARDRLRTSFLDIRERVAALVSRIGSDIPGLTVHDISHLDALWEIASLIAGNKYLLNAAEGYVLGGAILLHDAAMTLAAYPNGLDGMCTTDEWRDIVALILARRSEGPVAAELIDNPPPDVIAEAMPMLLRRLHAKQAERLATIEWPGADGSPVFLIQDIDLRSHYGALIGSIAASHWWNVGELDNLQPICAAGPGLPSSWTVIPKKVACLLRAADASHIDHRRAPRWLRALDQPKGESVQHWAFQQRMGKPTADRDALVFSSGEPFPVAESDAWWLCFDTVQMVDRELRDVHQVLEEADLPVFALNHVKASDTPSRLAWYIRTDGWKPADTRLRVSDVPSLVARFGGARLYGSDLKVPLRELIQNAADAIRARRCEPGRAADYGRIQVSLRKENAGTWLEVQDDGIGMSSATLTGALLDFGTSLWRTEAMQWENPGLLGRGLVVTGRFGIGFFSVFMLGKHVKVTSRHYRAAQATARTLEFKNGLSSRPVLRDPESGEALIDSGTRISVLLDTGDNRDGQTSPYVSQKGKSKNVTELAAMVSALCPTLDVQIDVLAASGKTKTAIKRSDWVMVPGDRLLRRVSALNRTSRTTPRTDRSSNLRVLKDSFGAKYGRACIDAWNPRSWYTPNGVVTVGGLHAGTLNHIGGVLFADEPETISRATAIPSAPMAVLRKWASEQAKLLASSDDNAGAVVLDAGVVLALGGDVGDLPIALQGEEVTGRWTTRGGDGSRNRQQLRQLLADNTSIRVFKGLDVEYDEENDDMHRRRFEDFEPDEDLIFVADTPPILISGADRQWPQCIPGYSEASGARTPFDAFRALVREVWGEDFDEDEYEDRVGMVDDYYEIRRDVTVFSRLDPTFIKLAPGFNLEISINK